MMERKVVVVTGAAMGIGRHIAHSFAQERAKLVLVDIASLDKVSIELRESGVEALALNADVGDEAQVESVVSRVISEFGAIEVWVNNAGIVPHFSWEIPRWPRISEMTKDYWDSVIGTNLGGTFLCTKHVLPHMEGKRAGHIINLHGGGGVGSTATSYVVTKDAIRTFTRYAAGEVKDSDVCVVAIAPGGAIATENAPEETRARLPRPRILAKRLCTGGPTADRTLWRDPATPKWRIGGSALVGARGRLQLQAARLDRFQAVGIVRRDPTLR